MNAFLHPGTGQKLRRVTGANNNTFSVPETTTIPDNGFSESVAAHDCLELMFNFAFAAATAAGKSVEIHASGTPDFAAYQTFETVDVSEQVINNWTASQFLTGFFRIKNVSGQNLTVSVQKRIQ